MADKNLSDLKAIVEPREDKFGVPPASAYEHNSILPKEKSKEFNEWVADQRKAGHDPLKDMEDYDVAGFFMEGGGRDARGHGTDKFKKPNHPTFSEESIYHGQPGKMGGRWSELNGKVHFFASPDNLKYRTEKELKEYFQKYEPDVTLVLPEKK